MKNLALVCIAAVFLSGSVVFGKITLLSNGQSSLEVKAGQTITVGIWTDQMAVSFHVYEFADTAEPMGTASNPWRYPGPAWYEWDDFDSLSEIINAEGVLVRNMAPTGSIVSSRLSGVVYGFDYTVPDLPVGTEWTITGEYATGCTICSTPPLELTLVAGDVEGPAFVVGGASTVEVAPGETIAVELITGPDGANAMRMRQIVDTAACMGTAGNQALSDGWDWIVSDWVNTPVNFEGVLFEKMNSVVFGGSRLFGPAFGFDYTVCPDIPCGQVWEIGSGEGTNKLGGVLAPLILTAVCDDTDDDGVPDHDDNCPDIANPEQTDSEGDGVGNECDNCWNKSNPDQTDSDGDGLGDECDCRCLGDTNEDGQVDLEDLQNIVAPLTRAGIPFVCCIDYSNTCYDLDDNEQVDLDDLQAIANMLLEAGVPFIVLCDT